MQTIGADRAGTLGPMTDEVVRHDQDEHAEPVVVAAYADLGEAEVAQAALRAFGIESIIVDRVEGGSIQSTEAGELSVGVEVRAADAAAARQALAGPADPV